MGIPVICQNKRLHTDFIEVDVAKSKQLKEKWLRGFGLGVNTFPLSIKGVGNFIFGANISLFFLFEVKFHLSMLNELTLGVNTWTW